MENERVVELVAREVNKIVSPKMLYLLVSLVLALLLACFFLWNMAATNSAWITSQQAAIKKLEAQVGVAEQLKQQTRVLEAIAVAVGAETTSGEKPEGGM